VEPRQIIRSGITASAIVHLSFLLLVIFFSEVHPFGAVPTKPIAVDLVTPEEVKEKTPEPTPSPSPQIQIPPSSDALDSSSKSAASSAASSSAAASNPAPSNSSPSNAAAPSPKPASTPQQAATPPQKQAASSPPAATQSSAAQPAPSTPASTAPAQPPPAYVPAQPDLSIKYHVLLGLPQDRPGDGFDAPAIQAADVGSSPIAEFRRHLKTCSKLPKSIAPTDKLAIKLRVQMTPDGRLAAQPVPIEGSASPKALGLMQSAIDALQACQPYAMLPADKYNEWKVLDLNFTPLDFTDAS
jgi:hypothetical protein